jgi:hypothetical protein
MTISGIALLLATLAMITAGCKSSEEGEAGPVGTLLRYGDCKNWPAAGTPGTTRGSDQRCIEYRYDGRKLELKHVNAGFNCCPGDIGAEIRVAGNVITITEREAAAGCHCLCLFDLDMLIEDLPAAEYFIQVHEPYIRDGEPLQFSVRLAAGTSGAYCRPRTDYPWGASGGGAE